MKILNASEILEARDVITKDVATPEWGEDCGVRIRNLTAAGRGVFIKRSLTLRQEAEASGKAADGNDFELELLLVAMTAVDEAGQLIFTQDQVAKLGEKSAAAVSRCAAVAQELSGLMPSATVIAVKPSAPTPS